MVTGLFKSADSKCGYGPVGDKDFNRRGDLPDEQIYCIHKKLDKGSGRDFIEVYNLMTWAGQFV